jgi:hypothetical protein
MVGDANGGNAVLDGHPLVVLAVFHAHLLLLSA